MAAFGIDNGICIGIDVGIGIGVSVDIDIGISIGIGIVIDFLAGFSLGQTIKWKWNFLSQGFHTSNWQKVQLNTELFSYPQRYLSANQMAWSKVN